MTRRLFVALDRDGTIIEERNYLADLAQVRLLPGAAAGLRQMQAHGFGLVVITNQSGIARGYFTEAQMTAVHERLRELLAAESIQLDGIYVCPHHPDDHCECRKPRPGLLERAARELNFDVQRAFVIGDKPCDIDLGRACGAKTILVRTGYGAEFEAADTVQADHVVNDLSAAATAILRSLEG
jgi:D-glycero-D-manno-heptose 1,7-bisphosphate phosphatase